MKHLLFVLLISLYCCSTYASLKCTGGDIMHSKTISFQITNPLSIADEANQRVGEVLAGWDTYSTNVQGVERTGLLMIGNTVSFNVNFCVHAIRFHRW